MVFVIFFTFLFFFLFFFLAAERYSSAAWWHNLRTLPTSVILHRIKHPLLAQTCWATAVSLLHVAFGGTWAMSVKVCVRCCTFVRSIVG